MKTRVIVAAAVAALLGCSDSSGPNNLGTITFTFTGGGGGTFSASGPAPAAGSDPSPTTSMVLGAVDATSGQTIVLAQHPRSGALVDFAAVTFDRATVGSVEIDPGCNWDADVCAAMILFLNFNGNGDSADFYCALTAGTLVISELTSSRVKGTFSGTGECTTSNAAAAPTPFTVSGGTFDVALVSGVIS